MATLEIALGTAQSVHTSYRLNTSVRLSQYKDLEATKQAKLAVSVRRHRTTQDDRRQLTLDNPVPEK